MAHTLIHPSGNFTVKVESDNRRDVLIGRGYSLTEFTTTVRKPKTPPRASKKPA